MDILPTSLAIGTRAEATAEAGHITLQILTILVRMYLERGQAEDICSPTLKSRKQVPTYMAQAESVLDIKKAS